MKIIRTPLNAAWTPFDRLAPWRDLFDSAFALGGGSGWAPALDVHEDSENITITVEAAGMKKDDFEISIEDDAIKIAGRREAKVDERRGESFRSERAFGQFQRTVTLPSAIKADSVRATYQDGILSVVLPKAEEAKPRKIEVQLN